MLKNVFKEASQSWTCRVSDEFRMGLMRLALAIAVTSLGVAVTVAPALASLSRVKPTGAGSSAVKTEVAVGEPIELWLKVDTRDCAYKLTIAPPPGSGLADQEISLETSLYDNKGLMSYTLPDGRSFNRRFDFGETVIDDVILGAPGRFEIKASSANPACKVKAPPVAINVRQDYSPVNISIYGRPVKGGLVKRLDGGWAITSGRKPLLVRRSAVDDLKMMMDSYMPGAWAVFEAEAFANRNVNYLSWWTADDPLPEDTLVFALGRETDLLKEDVAAGRLVKVEEISMEALIEPLRQGAREIAEFKRAQIARSEANRSALGDPTSLVGIRIPGASSADQTGPGR
ncbi:MAG: hypothetical protein EBS21_06640 [Sphingomonadaceae bacterium]|nr:hypothetical protein [Sphingomonadaceae bacterium]